MNNCIVLHPADNVAVALRDLQAGEQITLPDGRLLTLPGPIAFGHKLALRTIVRGEKILKYGLPIGSATRAIAPGEHVHVQNLKSDYVWREDR